MVGVMPVYVTDHVTLGRVTPGKGKEALGTVIAMRTTPNDGHEPVYFWKTEPRASCSVNHINEGCMCACT